jgi:hypothetical protein
MERRDFLLFDDYYMPILLALGLLLLAHDLVGFVASGP